MTSREKYFILCIGLRRLKVIVNWFRVKYRVGVARQCTCIMDVVFVATIGNYLLCNPNQSYSMLSRPYLHLIPISREDYLTQLQYC